MTSDFKSIRYTNRWFCYFDLLGFSNLVHSSSINRVIRTYGEVLDEIEKIAGPNKKGGVYYSWFSDTFIMYSRGPSPEEFVRLEQAGRLFFQKLIMKKVAVRGALTFGKLYSHLRRNVFVGPALIDAYKYGECQNWLGFLLTPNASVELRSMNLSPDERPFYRKVPKTNVLRNVEPTDVYAFAFNNTKQNGRNPYLKKIEEMRLDSPPEYQQKYENTERFIQANRFLESEGRTTTA